MVQTAERARGRPRDYDPEIALTRAMDLFWASGYAATSLDDLSSAMGMNRPSIYAAFGDKEALYRLAFDHYRSRARAASFASPSSARLMPKDAFAFSVPAID